MKEALGWPPGTTCTKCKRTAASRPNANWLRRSKQSIYELPAIERLRRGDDETTLITSIAHSKQVTTTRRLDGAACILLVALTAFRLWYAGHHELLQDEAYYWQWSRHLDWGYYDNTPLAAVIIRFFTTIFGSTELGVRAGAVCCALVASFFIYLLGKRLFDDRTAVLTLLLANIVVPLFAAGAIMMTMDPPQLALWAAAMYAIHVALRTSPSDQPTASYTAWITSGLLIGLAAQAKIYALLLLPSLLVYLVVSTTDRHWLRRPQPYLAAIIGIAILSPFLWWAHTHGNAFWKHVGVMGSRGDEQDAPFKFFFRYLGDPAGMLSPCLYIIFFYSLFDAYRRGRQTADASLLYVWSFTATVFIAFALVAIRTKTEANWPAAAYVGGVYLIAVILIRMWDSRSRVRRIWAAISVATASLMGVLVYFPSPLYAALGLGPDTGESTARSAMKIDRTTELYGWSQMAARIVEERALMGGDPFVFAINYRMPSEAAFYLPGHPQTYSLFLGDRANEYMFWEEPAALVGRNAVFINDSESLDHIDDLRTVFDHVEIRPPLLVHHKPYGCTPIRTIQVIRCYGFRGYDVKRWQKGW